MIKCVCLSYRSGKQGKLPKVPEEFVNLVRISLYKLVGVHLVPKELVCPEFFHKLRIKFQNASKRVLIIPFFLQKSRKLHLYTYIYFLINTSMLLRPRPRPRPRPRLLLLPSLCLLGSPVTRFRQTILPPPVFRLQSLPFPQQQPLLLKPLQHLLLRGPLIKPQRKKLEERL